MQALVNAMLAGNAGDGLGEVSVEELAVWVLTGEFGNGDARRAALGERYEAVQARENEMLA